MSYKLVKPFEEIEKNDFIVEHNHNKGLKIVETDKYLFALESNEIIINDIPSINPNYELEQKNKRKKEFEKSFFFTSLGWIKRKVNMKDGTQKDFLTDLLTSIKIGLELGNNIEIITYKTPNFDSDLTETEIISLQEKKFATQEFVAECLERLVLDFTG